MGGRPVKPRTNVVENKFVIAITDHPERIPEGMDPEAVARKMERVLNAELLFHWRIGVRVSPVFTRASRTNIKKEAT
jgi:hypothetical protein